MSNTYGKTRFANILFWRIVIIIGFIMVGLGIAGTVAEYIISLGIEWVSPTNLGMVVNGVWIIIAAAVAEEITDRLFETAPNFLAAAEEETRDSSE